MTADERMEKLLDRFEQIVEDMKKQQPTDHWIRPTGHWIVKKDNNGYYGVCSECGKRQCVGMLNYCSYCGTKMNVLETQNKSSEVSDAD